MSQNNNDSNSNQKDSYLKRYSSTLSSIIKDAKNKSPEERFRDRTALVLTIFIVSMIVFIFWKVPFLHNLIFP